MIPSMSLIITCAVTKEDIRYDPFLFKQVTSFELVGYTDAEFALYQADRMSTSEIDHFLGKQLISWGTKKQDSLAPSTVEFGYVVVASCYSQLL